MAFQCLKVWKCIWCNRGFWRVSARRLRVLMKVVFIDFKEPLKISVLFLGCAFIISISVAVTFHIRGFEPFSGAFSVIMFFSRSMSVHSRRLASPERMAVSFRICMKAAFFLPDPAIKASSSCSVGMKGNFRVIWHLGLFQDCPLNLRNSV